MPTSPESLAAGKCYLTAEYEVRKILRINGDWVDYVKRGRKAMPGWEQGECYQTTLRKFGGEVIPCSCDWSTS